MIRRVIGGVLLLMCVIIGGAGLFLLSSLPQLDGRIAVHGPIGEVRIARDADGVPLITAASDEDVAFGLGFAHAQDRLFQMELQRRYGAGRLAEIFGSQALATDRQMRVLGLYLSSVAEIPSLSPAMQLGLSATVLWVDAFVASWCGGTL